VATLRKEGAALKRKQAEVIECGKTAASEVRQEFIA